MRRVALIGAGMTRFGARKATYRDLIWEAGKACFDSIPGVRPADLEGIVVGSVMPERTAFQSNISSLAAEAHRRGVDGVICGHIHHAMIRTIAGLRYVNCGDWVESCSAVIEHFDGTFEVVRWTVSQPLLTRFHSDGISLSTDTDAEWREAE